MTVDDYNTHITEVTESTKEVYAQVVENVERAQQWQVVQYEKRKAKGCKVFKFKAGDLVLKRDMRNVGRKGDRMAPKWTGPFRYKLSLQIISKKHLYML